MEVCFRMLLLLCACFILARERTEAATITGYQDCPSKTKTLYVLVMAPFPDSTQGLEPGWGGGPAVVPGSQLAVRHINSRCDILQGYRLEVLVADSGCRVMNIKATVSLVESLLDTDHRVIAIIGPACSGTAVLVGELFAKRHVSLLNISPSATSPVLDNSTAYPNTFRILGSSKIYVNMYYDLISHLNITNVGILSDPDGIIHFTVARDFEKRLASDDNREVSSLDLTSYFIPLAEMQNKYRLIFTFANPRLSRQLMCFAYHKGFLYPDYQFVFSERRLHNFITNVSFVLDGKQYECSADEMREAVRGILLTRFDLIRQDKDTVLVNGMNCKQFADEYRTELEEYKQQLNLSRVVETEHQSTYYDSVWALALALNASIPRLENELNASLDNYSYHQSYATEIIRSELLNVEFEGITGKVKFNKTSLDGKDVTRIRMAQVGNGEQLMLVATYNPADATMALNLINQSALVPDKFNQDLLAPHLYVEAIVISVMFILTISMIAFQVINIRWQKAQSIKVTSPSLNHLIFIGCYFYVPSVLFLSFDGLLDDQHPCISTIKCIGFIWCESLALTLILGTISVKTFRILRIFSHASAKMMNNLQTYRLVLYVCALLIPDMILNVVWNAVDPWYKVTVPIDELHIRSYCTCHYIFVWLFLLFSLKILLMVVVLYLSISTRRISQQEYKQTKSTNALVFIFVMLYGLLIPLHYLTRSIANNVALATVSYLALCVKNILCVVMCTIFIFLPPVLPLLRKRCTSSNKS